jgi:hypothetical protein
MVLRTVRVDCTEKWTRKETTHSKSKESIPKSSVHVYSLCRLLSTAPEAIEGLQQD